MPGTGTFISKIFTLAVFATGLACAQDNYFPLHVGDQWVYRTAGAGSAQPVVLEVVGAQDLNGYTYYLTTGFGIDTVYLRVSNDGVLYSYDPVARIESTWVDFSAAEDGSYKTSIDSCSPQATIQSKSYKADLPIGSFANLFRVTYTPSCADAGIQEELYLPYIGLVRRTRTTFAGPRILELIYARIAGVTVVGAPETAFALTVDKSVYIVSGANPLPVLPMLARLTLRNTSGIPLALTYPSGQEFDFVLRNAKGDIVYRWSSDKGFTQGVRLEDFSGERNRAVSIPLTDANGALLPPGNYVLEASMTALPPAAFKAQVGIALR